MVPGNTYPIKDRLKALGCRFGERLHTTGKTARGWFFAPESSDVEEIEQLAANLPVPSQPDRSDWVPISGKTFELKEVLKGRFNARWDNENKAWIVAPELAKDAQSFVDCAGFAVVDNTGNPQDSDNLPFRSRH